MVSVDRDRILSAARDALVSALPDLWAIYVYGSFAREDEWPSSDIDLAILLPPNATGPNTFELAGEISQRTGRDVDLVDLRRVGDLLRAEVLAAGHVLFVSRPAQVLAWEASAMSRYARHREEIRGLLEDFRRTGVGYHR